MAERDVSRRLIPERQEAARQGRKYQQSHGIARKVKGRKLPWLADWFDEEGERHRKFFGTKAEAESHLTTQVSLRERVKDGTIRRDKRATLGQLLDDRLRDLELKGRSPSHRKATERTFKAFKAAAGGALIAGEVGPVNVDSYLESRRRGGCSVRTMELEATHLTSAFSWGKKHGLLTVNPLADYEAPHPTDADRVKLRRALREAEVSRFLTAASEDDRGTMQAQESREPKRLVPQRPLWMALIVMGSRWTETVSLRWHDVRDGLARFRPETRKRKVERKPFPMPPALQDELRILRRVQARALGRVPGPTDLVFLTPKGKPWGKQDTNGLRLFYRVLEAAGIAKLDLDRRSVDRHALRATCCTRMLRSGVAAPMIEQLLGRSAEVILRHYARPSEDDLREAVNRVPTPILAPSASMDRTSKEAHG